MPFTRNGTLARGLLAAVALVPSTVFAQRPTAAGGSRNVATARSPLNKVCSELASMPTTLTSAPEGRALLRMNKALEGAQAALETRGQHSRVDVVRMSEVQRGVDSLMQVVVQRLKDQDGKERTIVTIRGEGGARTTERFEQQRGQLVTTIRSLEPQVEALMGAVARGAVRVPMPTGWMGVYLSSSARTIPSPEGMLTYYCDYPVIESVHAGSPAEKGGLLAGDTLLAYNGRDLRADEVNLTKLLVPKRTLRVRFNRDGRVREVPLTIVPAPAAERVSFVRTACAPGARCEPRRFAVEIDTLRGASFVVTTGGGTPGQGNVITRSNPAVMGRATMPPVNIMLAGTGMAVLAGAQLSVIDEEFAAGMGVEPGVLVLRVPRGTPAAEAGLRPGDVIRALNGVPLREMAPLRQALGSQGTRQVRLTVSARGAPSRIVTVRW